MSCAALSIRAVRMAERGMDTRSETDDSGGLSLSAEVEDKGQSSRHRDTMESTITCNGRRRSASRSCVTDRGVSRGSLIVPGALCLQLWQVHQPESPVSAAPARPQTGREPAHKEKDTAWRGYKKKRIKLCVTSAQTQRSYVSHPLTAREFLASFSTCLAA